MKNKQFRISENCNFSGVYIILNLDNKKVYIGSTRNIERRLVEHEIKLRKNNHQNAAMQLDYNCGNSFIGYVITRVELVKDNPCSQDDNLRFFEYKAMVYFGSDNPEKGYNKIVDKKECREMKHIEWAKRYIENYFGNKEMLNNPKQPDDIKYHRSEMKRFLDRTLKDKISIAEQRLCRS